MFSIEKQIKDWEAKLEEANKLMKVRAVNSSLPSRPSVSVWEQTNEGKAVNGSLHSRLNASVWEQTNEGKAVNGSLRSRPNASVWEHIDEGKSCE